MNLIALIVGLLIGSVLVLFGAQNSQPVSLQFFAWQTPAIPIVFALASAILLGMLLSLGISVPGRIRGRRERQALERRVAELERDQFPKPVPAFSVPESPALAASDDLEDERLSEERRG